MLAGGFSNARTLSGEILDDVEIINGKNDEKCSKSVSPIFENDSRGRAYSLSGQFTKETAIICGGKNQTGDLDSCFELNIDDFR